jgi:peptidoglycan biosynthesis protein MviN/MurJ (putative lipid II flippase)
MGAGGIALAGTIAFTLEALVLLWLLARSYPKLGESRSTLLRAAAASVVGAGLVYAVMNWAPLPPLYGALAGLAVGGVAAVAIVWADIKIFMQMGAAMKSEATTTPVPSEP